MWERFTQPAKRAVITARTESVRLNCDFVDSDQLLLAICRDPGCRAALALESLSVDLKALASEIERDCQCEYGSISDDPLPFTQLAKRVLEISVEEARRYGHHSIGTEHILLALIKSGEGSAAARLRELNIDMDRVRETLAHIPPP